MQPSQQSLPRCPVYLHPAACTSRKAVEAIQQRTGLLVVVNLGRVTITPTQCSAIAVDQGPWGGDAA